MYDGSYPERERGDHCDLGNMGNVSLSRTEKFTEEEREHLYMSKIWETVTRKEDI